ncbi:hypothetical protein MBLNU457_3958t2 [Dothideomycetes sp. NU457]
MPTSSVACTYKWCDETFDTEKAMKEHKTGAKGHYYCKRCDYTATSWETLLEHKVEQMQPYLFGIKTLTKEDKKNGIRIMHIVCEFCGEEFKTWTSREKHRLQYHQALHDIPCKGHGTIFNAGIGRMNEGNCTKVFDRPSALIAHYERNECEFISHQDFQIARQQKYIAKQIMHDADHFSLQIEQSRALQDEGGVPLLDEDIPRSFGAPLKPKIQPPNIIDADVPISRATNEGWPRVRSAQNGKSKVPQTETDALTRRLQNVHIGNEHVKSKEEIMENLLVTRWWDSTSTDYQPDLFFHPLIEAYKCPFAGCQVKFLEQVGIDDHLRKAHVLPPITCPCCRRGFDTVQALVSHFEGSSRGAKCAVAKSSKYGKILDEVTGGFLDVEKVTGGVDKLVGYTDTDKRMDKDKALQKGLVKEKFASKAPKTDVQW